MTDRISIIVPTYNRKEMLRRLLESFTTLECSCPLEFIIIDDSSDDGTSAMVKDWKSRISFADVVFHRLDSRSGPARARNAGIALSTGTVIAFTDSDCVVDPGWAEHLYNRLISRPEYAGVGGRVLPLHDDIYSTYNTIYRVLEPPLHINAVIGANCMFWKQHVVDVGMFDDYFDRPGGEEIALCMKLWMKGYRFGFNERAVIFHDYRENFRDFIRTFYNYGIGERIIITHRLKDYFRYMEYPEKMHNYVAFNNNLKFQLYFLIHMTYGILSQQNGLLSGIPLGMEKKLKLNCLYAVHQICYHLGRGTFYGITAGELSKYLAGNPADFQSMDVLSKRSLPFLEIIGDTIPLILKPGQKRKSSIFIRNPQTDIWISAEILITIRDEKSGISFYEMTKPWKVTLVPGTELRYDFTVTAPIHEQNYAVRIDILGRENTPINQKYEKNVTVSSKIIDPDAKVVQTTFPRSLAVGQMVHVTISMRNTGTYPWSEERKIRLGTENDSGGVGALFGNFRIQLHPGEQIPSGSDALFSFAITAPAQPGEYTLRYRMVCEHDVWFGETIEKKIIVTKKELVAGASFPCNSEAGEFHHD